MCPTTACRFSYPKPPSDITVARVSDKTTEQNENNTNTMKDMAGEIYLVKQTSI